MTYYIYENWTAEKKAVIHDGKCGHCNNGKGCHDNKLGNRNGRWHPPFDTFKGAKKFGARLKNRDLRECSVCKPNDELGGS